MTTINQEQAATMIRETKGKLFTVEFIKKDGSLRVMNARLGVKKGVKGVGLAYNPKDYGLIGCYDMQAAKGGNNGFRMLNVNTLQRLTTKGITYQVAQEA